MEKLQRCYHRIKNKCYNKNNDKYYIYGARGICMCQLWLDNPMEFYNWALKNGVQLNLSIDRIDVNGNYCPENCRWANDFIQQNNKRTNIIISHEGERKTLKQWCNYYDIYYPSVKNRYNFCKKHDIKITNDIFNAIMKPSFYYKGKEFVNIVLPKEKENDEESKN